MTTLSKAKSRKRALISSSARIMGKEITQLMERLWHDVVARAVANLPTCFNLNQL